MNRFYFIAGIDLRSHREHPIYEVPDKTGMKRKGSRSWRDPGDGYVLKIY